jgi:chromosome segregation ATPase
MARTGIEEKDVFEAADHLIESGEIPTLQLIREKLGTGSFATISAHLKKWREQKIQESPIPEPPEALATALKQIWAAAYREATAQFEAARQAAEGERKKLSEENEHLVAEIGKLETAVSEEQAHRKTAEDEVASAKKAQADGLAQLQDTREKLAAATARSESAADRLKEALARSERLEGELAAIAKAQARPEGAR